MTHDRPLTPAIASVRLAVRRALEPLAVATGSSPVPVIVALSGGPDSLALAAAAAFEAPKLGMLPVAVIIDHGLQAGSADVAARAAEAAEGLGLEARIRTVSIDGGTDGPEAAARDARYAQLHAEADELGAAGILLGHTLDDQAESVLLGLARGSGGTSLQGMAPVGQVMGSAPRVRPLLGVRRATTHAFCADSGLDPWADPHNDDPRFARVRVRRAVLPLLESELGPGVAEALARTADQLREDAEAFSDMIDETIEDIVEHAEAGIQVSVAALAANPAALRNRIIRHVVASEFGSSLTRLQTLEVARLVTDWSGQGPIDLPGCHARREGSQLVFSAR